jgi:uncharacterized protein YecE (DUF72 family)
MSGRIRVGIGGWTFEPWRDNFYPKGWAKARELEYASTHVTAIEINGTFYSTQKPATWADWAKRTPDDFVFSVKASRFCTNRRVLRDGAESIDKFIKQGLSELGPKLGPILWQLAGTKQFDPEDMAGFLDMLPRSVDGVPLRHAIEPRHESFRTSEFVALARKANVAIVFADSDKYPQFADLTADFAYARLQNTREEEPTGYSATALDGWVQAAKAWATGQAPEGYAYIDPSAASVNGPRDAFLFLIAGAKAHNPAGAMALIERLR